MILVRELTTKDDEAYRAFVLGAERGWIYGSLEFRDFLHAVVPGRAHYLVATENDRIVGAFPLFEADVPDAGVLINSLPWYGSHGGCLVGSNDGHGHDARRALLASYSDRVRAREPLSATTVLYPFEQPHLDAYRTALQPAIEDSRIGQVTELPEDGPDLDDRLLAACSRKTRNLVRKSLKQGFEIVEADDDDAWRFLHATHEANLQAIGGTAKPWSHFVALRDSLPTPWRRIRLATLEGRPIAALLVLYFRTTVEYVTPVVVESYRSRQPLSFLIYHAMRDAVASGFREWNWGGTWRSQTTLYHFKQGWGAGDRPYTYLIQSADRGARLRQFRDRLATLFPYYYAYPYDQLA